MQLLLQVQLLLPVHLLESQSDLLQAQKQPSLQIFQHSVLLPYDPPKRFDLRSLPLSGLSLSQLALLPGMDPDALVPLLKQPPLVLLHVAPRLV